jgi:hypothetical protein
MRQKPEANKDALDKLTDEGVPFAGPTPVRNGRAPIWRQMEFWTLEDYQYNFDAYLARGKSNVQVARNIARHCRARYGAGPKLVQVVELKDEPI